MCKSHDQVCENPEEKHIKFVFSLKILKCFLSEMKYVQALRDVEMKVEGKMLLLSLLLSYIISAFIKG